MRLAQLKSLFSRSSVIPTAVQQQLTEIFSASAADVPAKLRAFESTFKAAVDRHTSKNQKVEVIDPKKYLELAMAGTNMQNFLPHGDIVIDCAKYYQIAAKGLEMPNLVVGHSVTSIPPGLTFLPHATIRGSVFLLDSDVKIVDLIVSEALYANGPGLHTITPRSRFGTNDTGESLSLSKCSSLKELDITASGSVKLAQSSVSCIKSTCQIGKDVHGNSLDVSLCTELTRLDVSVPGSVDLSFSGVRVLGNGFSCGSNKNGYSIIRHDHDSPPIVAQCAPPNGKVFGDVIFHSPIKSLDF